MTPLSHRERPLAWALLVPAIAATALTVGVEVWRLAAPASALSGHERYGTLGEAIVADDVRGAWGFLERGASPDALIRVHDPVLSGGAEVDVPPIVWATAAGRHAIVRMLLGAGVTFERPADRAAACLADELGFPEIATTLRAVGRLPGAETCPPRPVGPPLVSLDAHGR